jgi:nucleotidyltransferase substrate binding protein (TIGR01987 family)
MAPENQDVRWKQRFQSFRKAHGQLRKAVKIAQDRDLSELERQGLIKAFEFTYELSWNTMKDFLEDQGITDVTGPKPAIRKAFAADLIGDGETWMEMIQSRNRSSHTYNERIAGEIVTAIVERYASAFLKFAKRFRALERESS